jgi:hypothetical protein
MRTANEFVLYNLVFRIVFWVFYKKFRTIHLFCVCLKNFRTNCTDSHLQGLLYVTVLKIY